MNRGNILASGWQFFLEAGLLLVLPLVFYRPFTEQFSTPKIALTQWLIAAGVAAAAIGFLRRGEWPANRMGWPLAVLTFAVLLSCLNSPAPAFSLDHASYFLCGPAWLIVLIRATRNVNRVKQLSMLAAGAGTFVALIALGQWLGHDPLLFGGFHVQNAGMVERMNLYSTLGNPNFVAGYLVGVVPLALGLALAATRFSAKLFYIASASLMCAAVLGTESHGAWGALFVGALAWFWLSRPSRAASQARVVEDFRLAQLGYRPGVRSFSVIAPVMLWLATPMFANLSTRLVEQLQGRVYLWRVGWPLFTEHPLLGSGWASAQLRFLEFQAQFLAAHPDELRHWSNVSQLHNDWVQLVAETGLLGLAAFLWLIWSYGRELRFALVTIAPSSRPYLKASAAGVAAILTDAVFNFQLAIPPTLILLFTLLAFPQVAAVGQKHPLESRARHGVFSLRLIPSVAVIACAVLLMLQTARHVQAELLYAQGMSWEMAGISGLNSAEAQYRAGLALEPRNGRLHFGLSRILYSDQAYPQALAEAQAAQITYSDSHLEVLKGRILEAMGRREEAFATFRHALTLDPTLQTVRADMDRLQNDAHDVPQQRRGAATQ